MKRTMSLVLILLLCFGCITPLCVSASDESSVCIKYVADNVNEPRTVSTVSVFTSDFGDNTNSSGKGTEILVDDKGFVTAVESKGGNSIPENGFVISAGAVVDQPFSKVTVGDRAFYDAERKAITIVSEGYDPFGSTVLQYDGINTLRKENTLIIYRGKATSETNTWGYEIAVNSDGYIVSVGGNNNAIPENGFVVSAIGTKKQPLIDARALGMKVLLDETAKTVTISNEAQYAVAGYRMQYEEMTLEFAYKKARYLDIDGETASASLNAMLGICDDMQEVLSKNDIPAFIAKIHSFEVERERFASAVIPYNPVEARTIWLRIPANKSEASVKKVVKDIYDLGFNSVCIEAIFDSTTIMPMPEDSLFVQNPAFGGEDMLKAYIDEFHEYGIEVHLWMTCYRVGYTGSANTQHSVGVKKPEWLNLDQNGKETVYNEYGNAYFLNPALPEVKEFLLETYKYLLENYAIDGFQLDYVRYPENSSVNFGYDEYTKQKFKEKYGFETAPTSSSQSGWKEWCEFRASFVTDLVKSVGELIKEIRPDVVFSCDVAPDYASSKTKMCQDTETWLKENLVDVIYPMAYGTTDAVKKWTGITTELAGDEIYTVMGLRDNGAEIYREQITESFANGADGTAFFSYSQYIAGDYRGYIETSVFKEKAVNPTFSAKMAVSAQFAHIIETVNERILSSDATAEIKAFTEQFKKLASDIEGVRNDLDATDIDTAKIKIEEALNKISALASELNQKDCDPCKLAAEYLNGAIKPIQKAILNSKDAEKAKYGSNNNENNDDETSENISDDNTDDIEKKEVSWFNKIFQVIFMTVMTIGLVGWPAYILLNRRRRRIASENNLGDNEDEQEDSE